MYAKAVKDVRKVDFLKMQLEYERSIISVSTQTFYLCKEASVKVFDVFISGLDSLLIITPCVV